MKPSSSIGLAELSGKTYRDNVYLVGMHLRDATNILQTIRTLPETQRPDLLAKACVLFAVAGLESNLSFFCTLALEISAATPDPVYAEPELEYLKAVQTGYSNNAELSQRNQKQPLSERLLIAPKLLGKAFKREFEMPPDKRIRERLVNAIERRDAIIHPSWDRYPEVNLYDAADAVYGVLEYLESVRQQFHPNLIGYLTLLSSYFPLVADLVQEGSVPPLFRVLGTREELIALLAGEWIDAHMMFDVANVHPTEGDSEGSMLTRAALVCVYSMVMAHVSIFGRLAVLLNPDQFSEKEINFLNEKEYQWTAAGEAVLEGAKQRFEDRATIALTLISKKVSPRTLVFNHGVSWYQNMFKAFFVMRNRVMHSKFGETAPRVTKPELRSAFEAIRSYSAHVATAGGLLAFWATLLNDSPLRELTPDTARGTTQAAKENRQAGDPVKAIPNRGRLTH